MSDWWKHGRGRQRGLDAVRDARDAPCAGARTHDGTGDDGPVLELDGDRLMAELLEEPDELHASCTYARAVLFTRGDGLPLRIYPRGGVRAVEVARVESTNDPCVSARCRSRAVSLETRRGCASHARSPARV